MKAVILAGGEGTRLRPLTCSVPKPMVELAGKPLLAYTIELLKKHGICDICVTLLHLSDLIQQYFSDGSEYGAKCRYYEETVPRGTAGSVKLAQAHLDETFVVMNGDILTDADLTHAAELHRSRGAMVTILTKAVENPSEYGVVLTDASGRVTRLVQKPDWSCVMSDMVNTGIYLMEPEVLNWIPREKPFELFSDLLPVLLEQGMEIACYKMQEYWRDVSSIEAYLQAQEDILRGKVGVAIDGVNVNGLWVQEGVSISNSALIQAPCFIGRGAEIREAARIGQYSAIGENTIVGVNANLKRCAIGKNVSLNASVKVSHAVVAEGCTVGAGARILEGSVIGKNCILEEGVTVSPKIRIWPEKWIERDATINTHVVWGAGRKRGIFGIHGIVGEWNQDLLPDTLVRAGSVIGAVLARDGDMLLAADGSAGTQFIADLIAAGATAAGAKVTQTREDLLFPQMLLYANKKKLSAAVYVRAIDGENYAAVLLADGMRPVTPKQIRMLNQAYDDANLVHIDSSKLTLPKWVNGLCEFYLETVTDRISLTLFKEQRARIGLALGGDKKAQKLLCLACEKVGIATGSPGQGDLFRVRAGRGAQNGELLCRSGVLSEEEKILLVYALSFETFGMRRCYLPEGTLGGVFELARKFGVTWQSEREEQQEPVLLRLQSDFPYFCIVLAQRLLQDRIDLAEYRKTLPPCFTAQQRIPCERKDMGKILRRLSEQSPDGTPTIQKGRGRGRVTADEVRPVLRIWAEGDTQEFAKELCDFCAKSVRELLKK